MVAIDRVIVKKIKAYDPRLQVRWNNERLYFEVWRKMPWGDRLITPIVSNIYYEDGGQEFCPLDERIVFWLYQSDTQRKGLERNWRWLNDKRFSDFKSKQKKDARSKFRNIAADNYALFNHDLIGSPLNDETEWLKPDVASNSAKKVSYRSSENAKRYFDGEDL